MSDMVGSQTETNYRWYVLSVAALTHTLAVAIPSMCLPVLFTEIAADLNLSLVQIGLVWGLGALPGVITGLVGGVIGDRFGTRRTLGAACLLVGVAGALRGTSGDFATLGTTVVLFGLLSSVIPMNVHKTCGTWFSQRQLGLANGVASMGMALGYTLGSMVSATLMSPWLGGWRHVLFLYGAAAMALSLPWYWMRPAPGSAGSPAGETNPRPLRQTLAHVAGVRRVWLLGLAFLGISGCIQGALGYLPLYLRGVGWPGASADAALAAFNAVSMTFAIPIALWSDRLGSRKTALMAGALMVVTGVGLLSFADGALVWVAVGIAGLVRDGFTAVFMTTIIETKGVGPAYAGTAIGLAMAFAGLGNLIAPPLGNSLAGLAPGIPFAFWAALAMMGLLGLYLADGKNLPESSLLKINH